jgi:predicted esterase
LLDKRLLAIDAMRLAISALALSAPNARDYQTAAPDAFARATKHSFLPKQSFVDPKRAFVVGFSQGGLLSLSSVEHRSDDPNPVGA